MNTRTPVTPQRQGGFVLVTSLIFLVVVTLLAVSAINSSTLQERMASNLREKSRARQAADAALRRGEQLLKALASDTLPPPDSIVKISVASDPQKSGSNSTELNLKLWSDHGMFADANKKNDPAAFLDPAIWSNGKPLSYSIDPKVPTEYYIDRVPIDTTACKSNTLSPDSRANCATGSMFYRVTARAEGENPVAIAVTQSVYEKHY